MSSASKKSIKYFNSQNKCHIDNISNDNNSNSGDNSINSSIKIVTITRMTAKNNNRKQKLNLSNQEIQPSMEVGV